MRGKPPRRPSVAGVAQRSGFATIRLQTLLLPAEQNGGERERVAWQRAEERTHWSRYQRQRGKALGELEGRSKREWSALYGRQERQREQLAKDCRGVLGRLRAWRELGGGVREIGGAIRGCAEVLGRFRAELEDRLRWERVSLGKAHSEAVRGIESKAGEVYRCGMEGSEERAREAARMDGFSLRYRHRDVDWYRLKRSVSEERMEQVREIDGEQAYEKMMRAVEKASQEKAMQVERARQVERSSQLPARKRPERSGPERGGPERATTGDTTLRLGTSAQFWFNLKKLYELRLAEKKAARRSRPCRPLRMNPPCRETSLRNTSNTDWGMRKGPRTTLYA